MGIPSWRSKNRRTKLLVCCVVLLSISLILLIVVMVWHGRDGVNGPMTQSQRVISEVTRLYLVPTNETPTVARLQDKSKIDSNKAFYKNAQDGDYLVLYSQNGLALLYREQINKLVNVAPITDSGVSATQPSSEQ